MRAAVVDGSGVLGYAGLWGRTDGRAASSVGRPPRPGPPPGPGDTDGNGACGDAARCTGGAAACGDGAPGARPSVGRPNGTDGVGGCALPGERIARCTGGVEDDADEEACGNAALGPAPGPTGAGPPPAPVDTDGTGGVAAVPTSDCPDAAGRPERRRTARPISPGEDADPASAARCTGGAGGRPRPVVEPPGGGALPVPTRRSGTAVGAALRCTAAAPGEGVVGNAEVSARAGVRGIEAGAGGRSPSARCTAGAVSRGTGGGSVASLGRTTGRGEPEGATARCTGGCCVGIGADGAGGEGRGEDRGAPSPGRRRPDGTPAVGAPKPVPPGPGPRRGATGDGEGSGAGAT
ncbi:hypothetical protein [Streptomyces sp. BRA346]|uniref:hypothetical protein n=1 Tax=Streptomyces sp. BRA346 TaxID=2878199 RepID=UPI0040643977